MLEFNSPEEWHKFLETFNFEKLGFTKKQEGAYVTSFEKNMDGKPNIEVNVFNKDSASIYHIQNDGVRMELGEYDLSDYCELLKLLSRLNLVQPDDPILQRYKLKIGCY